ncbi:Modification methylase BspRI [Thalassovita gelatinovora]|uniref:DNA (cytosine-5-)-methyltransferase n=1 Tax=Thalassovita gelatinovora TaxID=53501 RepID=A0A0P1G3F4_THAGE|nr:DNA cytosine methyltransferase [Thalassovita gelatinovora]CUH67956.1 Modification methylase BspRI [Thalassovita gelatinovora]SEQ26250.1 DNA (cytosine-5)-methyltransferase 1 [Thalassovita gelatinovora]
MAVCPTSRHEEIFGVSLCAGVGGLDLGLHLAEPGYRTVCYVERNSFAAATLVARMADASLAAAPVWDDLRSFDGRAWRGKVHLLSAGYPCQPFTLSGLRRGEDDPRHLWPQVARIVAEIAPEWCFFENVPGHLTLGLQDVARDLQAMGYRVAARIQPAAEVGASHRRDRLFILAHADLQRVGQPGLRDGGAGRSEVSARPQSDRVASGDQERDQRMDASVGSVEGQRLDTGPVPFFAPGPGEFDLWGETLDRWPGLKPGLYRPDDGLASGLDRTAAAGNGVVPLAAARAFTLLRRELQQ